MGIFLWTALQRNCKIRSICSPQVKSRNLQILKSFFPWTYWRFVNVNPNLSCWGFSLPFLPDWSAARGQVSCEGGAGIGGRQQLFPSQPAVRKGKSPFFRIGGLNWFCWKVRFCRDIWEIRDSVLTNTAASRTPCWIKLCRVRLHAD